MKTFLAFVEKCKQLEFLQIFTIYLRYLIGAAFIIAAFGMGKFSGQQFQSAGAYESLEKMPPMLQFFRVMAESGLYWQFIGFMQVVGGALLMSQRFAKVGAIIFFGLILNIFIITVSYKFEGTPIITGLMLMATAFLLLWDLGSFQFIFMKPIKENLPETIHLKVADNRYWVIIGTCMLVTVISMAVLKVFLIKQLTIAFLEGLFAFCLYLFFLRRKMLYAKE